MPNNKPNPRRPKYKEKEGSSLTKHIGKVLRQLREKRGFSALALERESSVSDTEIRLIENGLRSPSADTLSKLSIPLKVHPGDFFPGKEKE